MSRSPVDTSTPRVALYARISYDRAGEGLGVERQMGDLRALAAAQGWRVVAELTDNDVSAYSGARRPGYESLLALAKAGGIDKVAAWHVSRLWRGWRERSEALETFAARSIAVATCNGPAFDLTTEFGRSMARMLGELDTMESAVKSDRVKAAVVQRLEKGKPLVGLGYGYTRDDDGNVVVVESEAAIVREAFDRLLAGESTLAVCGDFMARNVPPPGARHRRGRVAAMNPDLMMWRPYDVKRMLLRPTLAGLLVHKGQVVGPGTWPAIVTAAEQAELRAVLTLRGRKFVGNPTGAKARKWLLSWTDVCVCDVCGGPVTAKIRRQKYGEPYGYYACPHGHATRTAKVLEPLAELAALERLSQPDVLETLSVDAGGTTAALAELERLRGQLADAVAEFEAGGLSAALLGTVEKRLAPRIAELESDAVMVSVSARVAGDTLGPFREARDPRAVWDALDVSQRLEVLEVLGVRIRVKPTKHRGPGYDPDDVTVDYAVTA